MAQVLRWWLNGQGMAGWRPPSPLGRPGADRRAGSSPGSGFNPGLVNFIPYFGPVIAAVPIVLAPWPRAPP